MKKGVILFLALLLTALAATTAFAAGKATVTQEAFYVLPYYDESYAGHVYGEITNTGDKNVEMDSGVFEFLDAEGDPVATGRIYSFYPEILPPGGKGYYYLYENIAEASEADYIDDYSVTVVGKSTTEDAALLASSGSFEEKDYYGEREIEMIAEIENNTEEIVWSPYVAFALYDANDVLVYVDYESGYGMGLYPGSKIIMTCSVRSAVQTYLNENAIEIGRIEVIAWHEGK